jgi:hypothetical protein
VISVAIDRSADDARPWIEAAAATHPSLIDSDHRLADLFGIVNVPTLIWIDEHGRLVHPHDVAFGSDVFKELTGFDSGPYLDAIRDWVRTGAGALSADEIRAAQMLPTADEQQARAEFGLGWDLHRQGRTEAAVRHFARAGELSPDDFTIRRGSMPILGIDPMTSPEFMSLYQEWTARGRPAYRKR